VDPSLSISYHLTVGLKMKTKLSIFIADTRRQRREHMSNVLAAVSTCNQQNRAKLTTPNQPSKW